MPAFLSWRANLKSPGGILSFDAVLSETLELTSEVTEFPVEQGADVTDHIREKADKITLEVEVSNTPISPVNRVNANLPRGAMASIGLILPVPPASHSLSALLKSIGAALFSQPKDAPRAAVLLFDAEFSATLETLEVLDQLRREGRLLDVISRDWFRDNMIVETISAPRTNANGTSATFTVMFKRIRIVETRQTLAAVPAEPRGKGTVSAGKKGSTPPIKKSSILNNLLGGGGGDLASGTFPGIGL